MNHLLLMKQPTLFVQVVMINLKHYKLVDSVKKITQDLFKLTRNHIITLFIIDFFYVVSVYFTLLGIEI